VGGVEKVVRGGAGCGGKAHTVENEGREGHASRRLGEERKAKRKGEGVISRFLKKLLVRLNVGTPHLPDRCL